MKRYIHNLTFRTKAINLALTILFSTIAPDTFADDGIGRLFTTPQERTALEKLRQQRPVEIIKPEIVLEEPEIEEERPEIGGITVNGLVYRKGGKSTAWVNSANTYEGNFGNQYIQVDAKNIKPDDVEISIPVTDTSIKLKAGETYTPEISETTFTENQ